MSKVKIIESTITFASEILPVREENAEANLLFFFFVTGLRFGLLQTKVGIVSVLSKYSVRVSDQTTIPLEFNKKAFILTPISGIPLKLIQRK